MIIKLNGKDTNFEGSGLTLAELLKKANVENPDMVSVQLNGEFVDKGRLDSIKVKEGDAVDFMYFMGGGKI